MKATARFRLFRAFIAGWLLTIFVAAHVLVPLNSFEEVFPFFHWALFASPPKPIIDYSIEFNVPSNSSGNAPGFAQPKAGYWIVQKFGRSWTEGRADADILRKLIESRLFGSGSVSYALVRREYLAVEFARDPSKVKKTLLETFER